MEDDDIMKQFFPLLIEYQDNKQIIIVEKPKDIDNNRTFKVKQTNC